MTSEYHKRKDREGKLVMVGIFLFLVCIFVFSISLDYLDEPLLKFIIIISALTTNYIHFKNLGFNTNNDYLNLLYAPFLALWIFSSFGFIGIIIYSLF